MAPYKFIERLLIIRMRIVHIANLGRDKERFRYMFDIIKYQVENGYEVIGITNKRPPKLNFDCDTLKILSGKRLDYLKQKRNPELKELLRKTDAVFCYTKRDLSLILYIKKKLKLQFKIVTLAIGMKKISARDKKKILKSNLLIFTCDRERLRISREMKLSPDFTYVLYGNPENDYSGQLTKQQIETGLSPDTVKVFFPGDFSRNNNQRSMINAIAFLDPGIRNRAVFFFYGNKKHYSIPELEEYARFKNVLTYCRFINFPDLYNQLLEIDLGVISTSVSVNHHRWAMKLMFMQAPVITSDLGVLPELIDYPGNGIYIEPNNEKGFADAIAYLITHPDLRKKMGDYGFDKFKKNYSKRNFKDTNQKIMKILNGD